MKHFPWVMQINRIKTYRACRAGQLVPAVLGRVWPRFAGLGKHLLDVFVRGAKELSQGLVLGQIKFPQIAGPALAWKDPAIEHHLDHIDKLDVLVDHALYARLQRCQLVRRSLVQALL